MNDWNIKIIDVGYRLERDVFFFRKTLNGTQYLDKDGGIKVTNDGSVFEPTMRLSPESLQAFANELANVGYRPHKEFVEGKLEATEKHLEDMRNLVFSKAEKVAEAHINQKCTNCGKPNHNHLSDLCADCLENE